MTQTCVSCRFFSPTDRTDFGHCRRRAPRVGRETGWHEMFPNVMSRDWCGEHESHEVPCKASAHTGIESAVFSYDAGARGGAVLRVVVGEKETTYEDWPAIALIRAVIDDLDPRADA